MTMSVPTNVGLERVYKLCFGYKQREIKVHSNRRNFFRALPIFYNEQTKYECRISCFIKTRAFSILFAFEIVYGILFRPLVAICARLCILRIIIIMRSCMLNHDKSYKIIR